MQNITFRNERSLSLIKYHNKICYTTYCFCSPHLITQMNFHQQIHSTWSHSCSMALTKSADLSWSDKQWTWHGQFILAVAKRSATYLRRCLFFVSDFPCFYWLKLIYHIAIVYGEHHGINELETRSVFKKDNLVNTGWWHFQLNSEVLFVCLCCNLQVSSGGSLKNKWIKITKE